MRLAEYASYDALGLKALLDAGEVSRKELREICLHAIEVLNPRLNFMTVSCSEEVIASMASSDAAAPFAGVPFLVKEGVGVSGVLKKGGSRLMQAGVRSDRDSELVRRIKQAGLVILGCTNIPEFANATTTESIVYGPARNPWNLEYSVGGSSGGAASAVASGVVPMAQASDGAGSIRIPAHCCGVFGLMPSRGRNPCGPDSYGLSFGIVRQHVITRSVRDSAAALDVLHGPESGALFRVGAPARSFLEEVGSKPAHLKICFSTRSPSGREVHSECNAAVENAARLCQELGHHVEAAELPYDWEAFARAFGDSWCFNFNFVQAIARQMGHQVGPDSLERSTLLTVQHGGALTSEQIYGAFARLHSISRDVEDFFSRCDIFLSPSALMPAPRLGTLDSNAAELDSFAAWFDKFIAEFAPFSPVFNASGQPAMSVPFARSTAGLPIGVQFAGRVGEEASLFRLAAQLEEARPWAGARPPVGLTQFDQGTGQRMGAVQ